MLISKGFNFDALFYGEDLINGKKDLQLVSAKLQIPLENILLVDDSSNKKVGNQNFIQISAFNPENQ